MIACGNFLGVRIMPKSFRGNHSQVLAAVKMGDDDHPSLKFAAQLCRRTGMRLRLVSVVDLDQFRDVRYAPNDLFDFTLVRSIIGDDAQASVEDELRRMAMKLDVGSPVTTSVSIGKTAQCVIAEATVSGSSVIVTGASKGNHRFVLKGLSTALSLMAESPVPVAVINDACHVDLTRESLKIFVADELSGASERAVLVAFDLALALRRTDVVHVHANPLDMETFAKAIQRLENFRDEGYLKDFGPSEMWDAAQRDLLDQIRHRASSRTLFLETVGGKYQPEVLYGGVLPEMEKTIEAQNPDLLVFGRHHTVHRRPFSIGKVPFHFMLSHNRPLVIVPS